MFLEGSHLNFSASNFFSNESRSGCRNQFFKYFKEGLTHPDLKRQKIHGKQMELLGDLVYLPNPKLWSLVLMNKAILKMGL
jgi:hypothetical protein